MLLLSKVPEFDWAGFTPNWTVYTASNKNALLTLGYHYKAFIILVVITNNLPVRTSGLILNLDLDESQLAWNKYSFTIINGFIFIVNFHKEWVTKTDKWGEYYINISSDQHFAPKGDTPRPQGRGLGAYSRDGADVHQVLDLKIRNWSYGSSSNQSS